MNKKWDYDVPSVELWQECLRVLKPGGHLLAACGTRTQHRMATNIEDAGFEIRDLISYLYSTSNVFQELYNSLNQNQQKLMQMVFGNEAIILWAYGSGFPKSLNIGKQISKLKGEEREIIGKSNRHKGQSYQWAGDIRHQTHSENKCIITKGTSEFEGWGTALKPAMELWTMARKPISEKNIAENVLRWHTGGINIDGCRISHNEPKKTTNRVQYADKTKDNNRMMGTFQNGNLASANSLGRFPANLILDGSEEVVAGFPETNPSKDGGTSGTTFATGALRTDLRNGHTDNGGSASRFFYTAKAHSSERNYGLEGFEEKRSSNYGNNGYSSANPTFATASNHHPTVKSLELMKYLVRLVTPKGGVCLDAFMGSGTTGMACKLEHFDFIGIELEPEYFNIAKARIDAVGEVTGVKLDNGKLF